MTTSAFGVEHGDLIAKRDRKHKAERRQLRERARSAAHPPPVKLEPADSSFITATGYQKPTRRLALEMKSRPGDPYLYRASPKQAASMQAAPSLGAHYSAHVRGKYKHASRYTPADRARLFSAKKEN